MPALPWISSTDVSPETVCVAMASRLPLAHYRHIVPFLQRTMAVRRQLSHTDGLIGYALNADLIHKTFWTVSAWRDRESLTRFNQADPHHAAAVAIHPHMQPSRFVVWTCRPSDLPIPWDEARRRLADAS